MLPDWGQLGDPFEDADRGPRRGQMFKALPHVRCECWRCMEVRETNQAVRLFMGWRQPDFQGWPEREAQVA